MFATTSRTHHTLFFCAPNDVSLVSFRALFVPQSQCLLKNYLAEFFPSLPRCCANSLTKNWQSLVLSVPLFSRAMQNLGALGPIPGPNYAVALSTLFSFLPRTPPSKRGTFCVHCYCSTYYDTTATVTKNGPLATLLLMHAHPQFCSFIMCSSQIL